MIKRTCKSIQGVNVECALGRPSNTTLRVLCVKGGGTTPQIRNPLFAEKKIRKRGGGGTPQIRNLFFFYQNQVFFEQKTQFLALFEEFFVTVYQLNYGQFNNHRIFQQNKLIID